MSQKIRVERRKFFKSEVEDSFQVEKEPATFIRFVRFYSMWMPLTSPYSLQPPHNIPAIGTFIAASVMTSCSHEVMTEVTQNCSELWGIYRSKTYINMDDLKLFTEAPEVMMQQHQVRFFLLMLWNLPNLGPTKIRNCFISFHPSLRHMRHRYTQCISNFPASVSTTWL